MTTVVVVCEGRTEQTFVRDVLAPALAPGGILLETQLINTSRTGRGGALSWERVLRHLRNLLLQRRNAYVTTFFDLYQLDNDFPHYHEAARIADPIVRAQEIEGAFAHAVVTEAGCLPQRFVPHIQPYEYEALLFSEVGCFGEEMPEWQPFIAQLQAVRDNAPTPEHINDGPATHPSARLVNLLTPGYRKVLHGSAIAARIGLDCIRERCVHFADWLRRIEALQPL